MSAALADDYATKKCRKCSKDRKFLCPRCGTCEWCHERTQESLKCDPKYL